jgi:hypothetical protein
MKKFIPVAVIACAASLPAWAQPAQITAPTTQSGAVTGKTFSVQTSTIGELLDNPSAKAVFEKYLPEIVANPQLEQGRAMTLPDIVQYAPEITPDKLAAIDADLKALPPQ